MSPAPFPDASGLWRARRPAMVTPGDALPGRATRPYPVREQHAVLDTPLDGPWPAGSEVLYVAMGCFWGAERIFWRTPGVVGTAVGYLAGYTPHPTYDEVCTGRTGHAEAVRVVYDPARVTPQQLIAAFFENHDPTTADRQGNDVGTQYRSGLWWTTPGQRDAALAARAAFSALVQEAGHGPVVTEVRPFDEAAIEAAVEAAIEAAVAAARADGATDSAEDDAAAPQVIADGIGEGGHPGPGAPFYLAEDDHQQYLDARPWGYCNHGPNGFTCPTGVL